MKDKFLDEIERNNLFSKNDRIAVAFSGGVDSVVLLHCLKSLSEKIGFKLFAFHINHNIRKESCEDEAFCENFAKSLNVEFYSESVNVLDYAKKEKMGIEQSARILRYNALNKLAKTNKVNKICLAHHKNDQIETILMHIERGSGVSGLVGMKMQTENMVRPLLNLSREDIEQYARQYNLQFVFDKTNDDISYKRNFVRKVMLPKFKSFSFKFDELLLRLSKLAIKFENKIENLLPKNLVVFNKNVVKVDSNVKKFDKIIVSNTIRYALKGLNFIVDIEEKHIDLLIDLFDKQVGKKIDLPNGLSAIKEYNGIDIYKKGITVKEEIAFALGEFCFGPYKFVVTNIKPLDKKYLMFDMDKLPHNVVWRNYKQGDIITKFDGSIKSVKEFCTSKKISAKKRSEMPMLCFQNVCFCIAGVEVNSNIKIDENTKKICYLYEVEN